MYTSGRWRVERRSGTVGPANSQPTGFGGVKYRSGDIVVEAGAVVSGSRDVLLRCVGSRRRVCRTDAEEAARELREGASRSTGRQAGRTGGWHLANAEPARVSSVPAHKESDGVSDRGRDWQTCIGYIDCPARRGWGLGPRR
jgi:hypothetical protein